MKFLADMGISPKTAALLRTLGHDAMHLQEQGLERLPDPAILAKALEEKRILLTHDLGFGELVAASGARLPSVIIFRLRNMHPDSVNHYLMHILPCYSAELAEGAIISVTEGQLRLRSLPVIRLSYRIGDD
jgi:predicted nuclease of predicted toxin-antitoxin system